MTTSVFVTTPAVSVDTRARARSRMLSPSGLFAIADQLLFAGTNFAVSIVLARLLSLSEYGAYATAGSVLLLAGLAHTAVLTEPMLVFGASAYAGHFRRYLRILLRGHWLLTCTSGAVIVAGAVALSGLLDRRLVPALAGLGVAMPAILVLWMVRRAFYLVDQASRAAAGGFLYLVLVLVGIAVASSLGALSSALAFIVMGTASLVVYLWFRHLLLSSSDDRDEPNSSGGLATVRVDHWSYGRWALAATVVAWLPTNVYFLVVPHRVSLETVGELRMVTNMLMLLIHLLSPLSLVFLPTLSGLFSAAATAEGLARARSFARKTVLFFAVVSVPMVLVFSFFSGPALRLVYGPAYTGSRQLGLLLALLAPPTALAMGLRTVLRAMQLPRSAFYGYASGSVVTVVLGIPLWLAWGSGGAMGGMLAAAIVSTVHLADCYRRALTRHRPGGPATVALLGTVVE